MNQSIPKLALSASLLFLATTVSALQIPLLPESHSEGYKFDALLHLPGISPYFDAIGSGLSHKAPLDCEVTAASYLIRHAAIYANDKDYETYIEPFIKKLNSTVKSKSMNKKKAKRGGWIGPLSFFNKWIDPIPYPSSQLEEITPQGFKDSEAVGKHLLSRYPKLVPTTKKIYADTKSRTQDTAKAFVRAFPQDIEIVEIDSNRTSFHSQNPHKACSAFSKEPGDNELHDFTAKYTRPIIARLTPFSPVDLTENDIMGLQQLCGYESAINGKKSSICDVFTDDEWMAYEYAWDLKYSLMVGHGNPLSPYLGFPWLNTTEQLMSRFHAPRHHDEHSPDADSKIPNDDGQRFFLSFTHREVPPFIATALGLFNSSNAHAEEFPLDRINWSRNWRMAELIPFLGHIGIEKLTCERREPSDEQHHGLHKELKRGEHAEDDNNVREYIRIIANSAPRPIPNCQGGPGASCSIDGFSALVRKGMETYGDFDGICENDKDNEMQD